MKITNYKLQITNKIQFGHWNLVIGICLVIGIWLLVILGGGCARMVTERVPIGDQMVVDFYLRGNFDFANKYYFLISTDQYYQVPTPPLEFIEPGVPPGIPGEDYYRFYSTWSDYVVMKNGLTFLVKGPFTGSQETYTTIQIGSFSDSTNHISFILPLDQVFGASIPATVYFNIISVDDLASRQLKDSISPPTRSITTYAGISVSDTDPEDPIDGSLDIRSWTVSIR